MAQVRRCSAVATLGHCRRGDQTDRRDLRHREGGARHAARREDARKTGGSEAAPRRLKVWLAQQLTRISGPPLAGAIRYTTTRLKQLRPYLDHGILELDNNTAERAMRGITAEHKN